MEGKRLLHSIDIKNLLSFGSDGVSLELEPLNVLIGPNASGKSNLIEAMSLFAAAPRDIREPVRKGGGVLEWLWKEADQPRAELYAAIAVGEQPLYYYLSFTAQGSSLLLTGESLARGKDHEKFLFLSEGQGKGKAFMVRDSKLAHSTFEIEGSLFAQLRDPVHYPELTEVGQQLGSIRFFRGWGLGRETELRRPQKVDLPDDFLLEDASNLGLVLNSLKNSPSVKRSLLEKLRLFYDGIEDFETRVQGGTIQVFLHERGDRIIPATRLSDGTLHYLCLLSILCHPDPPPLICIEEPELGLHPDILPTVADLLVEASQRTQLIVTTHSEALVSSLSRIPEAVVICERTDAGTSLRRLEPEKLKEWLERYRLGELWSMGEIGGNRW
jgi:predicted ATPase